MFKQTTNYEAFRRQLKSSARNENLESYSDKEYDNFQVYTNNTGTVGFAITPGKELVNLFNNSGIRGYGRDAITFSIELGATRLNCFDGPLVKYYESFGFEETSRISFREQYAPFGWHYSKLGRPDVVHMGLKES